MGHHIYIDSFLLQIFVEIVDVKPFSLCNIAAVGTENLENSDQKKRHKDYKQSRQLAWKNEISLMRI